VTQDIVQIDKHDIEKSMPPLDKRGTLKMVLEEGGPGFCQFAINNACNARCGFCNFSRDTLSKDDWVFVALTAAFDAIDILYRQGIRYLVITGGEPLLHHDLAKVVTRAARLGMKVLLVTNGSLLTSPRIRELANAGLSSFLISIDAMDVKIHESNRGLPGVCERILESNRIIKELRLGSTASVTMSRLVDYENLPPFLQSLGFSSVTFSYPLTYLGSSFLGCAKSELVNHNPEELIEAFEKIKRIKKRFRVVNPTPSIEEMQRFLRNEHQRYPCLGGYKYFYLDWKLDLWRCHNWKSPMCSIYEFDGSQRVRDNCTMCMIDCYRDASVMHYIGLSIHDAYQSLRSARFGNAAKALLRRSNIGSVRAVFEEFEWIIKI
jgi:MoaA/NifB/PqqE/SkfB family radical SAM enzyme